MATVATPHIEYQDKLYDGLLAVEAVIDAVEMYQSHEQYFLSHLTAVRDMLDSRIKYEYGGSE